MKFSHSAILFLSLLLTMSVTSSCGLCCHCGMDKEKGGSPIKPGSGSMKGGIIIDGGNAFIKSNNVMLDISVTGADEMRFSNDNEYWSPWEKFRSKREWKLCPHGVKQTVYGEFRSNRYFIFNCSNHISFFNDHQINIADGPYRAYFGRSVSLSAHAGICAVGVSGRRDIPGIDETQLNASTRERVDSVIVYHFDGKQWKDRAHLYYPGKNREFSFGSSVAVSPDGSTIAVGAPGTEGNGSGTVFLHRWVGKTWDQEAQFSDPRANSGESFGAALAVSGNGNVVVIGAQGKSYGGNTGQGAMFIHEWNGRQWIQCPEKNDPSGKKDFFFGRSVAVSGDGLTAAAGGYIDYRFEKEGAVFVYRRDMGVWKLIQTLLIHGDTNRYNFGSSAAFSFDGSVLVIGAPPVGPGQEESQGSLYIFRRMGESWKQEEYIDMSKDSMLLFADTVGISSDGSTVAAHALLRKENQGAVFVYQWNGSRWKARDRYTDPNAGPGDRYGETFSLSGDGRRIAIGSWYDSLDNVDRFGTGAVLLY